MSFIFISYRRGESAGYAGRLHESLERRFGEGTVFRDVDGLQPGQDFVSAISTSLRDCSACLVLVGRQWLDASDATGGEAALSPDAITTQAGATTQGITLPRLAEAAHGHLLYTVLAGDIGPDPDGRIVRLRIRMSNEGSTAANFWDSTFRLALTGQTSSATSGINSIVSGHSVEQAVFVFRIPVDMAQATLEIANQGAVARIPLDLRPSAAASRVDTPDSGDALSRADIVRLTTDAVALTSGKDGRYTLVSLTVRRFVNVLRIVADIRFVNTGPYPAHFSRDAVRVIVENQPIAPFDGPNQAVDGDSTATGAYVFDVPPSTRHFALRVRSSPAAPLRFEVPGPPR